MTETSRKQHVYLYKARYICNIPTTQRTCLSQPTSINHQLFLLLLLLLLDYQS